MKFKFKRGALIISSALVLTHGAFAAKTKRANETYSATTDDGSELEGVSDGGAPAYVATPVQSAPLPTVQQAPAPLPASRSYARNKKKNKHSKIALASTQPAQTGSPGFDAVPPGQAESIARRLKLVEIMIRKYGRAYDYRMHTLRDLEMILAKLDATQARAMEVPPPPPPQPDPARNTMSAAPASAPVVTGAPALPPLNDEGLEDSDSAAAAGTRSF